MRYQVWCESRTSLLFTVKVRLTDSSSCLISARAVWRWRLDAVCSLIKCSAAKKGFNGDRSCGLILRLNMVFSPLLVIAADCPHRADEAVEAVTATAFQLWLVSLEALLKLYYLITLDNFWTKLKRFVFLSVLKTIQLIFFFYCDKGQWTN